MNTSPQAGGIGNGKFCLILLVLGCAAVAVWLWVCWCVFPLSVWNDVRLAPSLALLRGENFYPQADFGAVTTWIYGPLPVYLWSPAALAGSPAAALLAAGAINGFLTLAALIATIRWWPAPIDGRTRLAAGLIVVAIWPFAAFQYLQADNVAIALALAGNLLLVRSQQPKMLWAAAVLSAGALLCKQTSIGIGAAQIVWLALTHGRKAAVAHLGRCTASGVVLAALLLGPLDWRGAWFNMVTVPGGLPWAPDPMGRAWDMAPELLVHVLIPALILAVARRRIFPRNSPLLLPTIAYLCTLPPSVAAFFKFGGTLNSLQGFTLWAPAALLSIGGWLLERRVSRSWLVPTCVALAALIVAIRLGRMEELPLRPVTEHYRQAEYLAVEFPGQIWFPWNPLVTAYSEQRYHVEDGMSMRFLAGRAITMDHANRALPPRMAVIALPRGGTEWGIALSLKPQGAQVQDFGLWTLHSWDPGTPGP
jgi:hypothetical protein